MFHSCVGFGKARVLNTAIETQAIYLHHGERFSARQLNDHNMPDVFNTLSSYKQLYKETDVAFCFGAINAKQMKRRCAAEAWRNSKSAHFRYA